MLKHRAATEENLDRLDKWINRSHGRSSMIGPVPGTKELLVAVQGRFCWSGKQLCSKGPGVLARQQVDHDPAALGATRAKSVLHCYNRSTASTSRDLFSSITFTEAM